MPEIILDDLRKEFDGVVAADGLSLTIGDGEYVCILGPTGAGKTTCMRMVCGLTKPDSGRVLMDGRDVTDDSVDSRNATMLSQTYALFPHLNVYDNVMFAPRIKEWPEDSSKQIVRSMLHMVHLEQKAEWKPGELSGGQQQRVSIARALAKNPKLLLCDEPTGALDYNTGKQILSLLQSACREGGMTVIVVTHNTAITPMADRVITIRNSKVASNIYNPHPADIATIEW